MSNTFNPRKVKNLSNSSTYQNQNSGILLAQLFLLAEKEGKEIEKVTETELILSLCKEKDLGVEGSNEDKLRKFRETYGNQGDLLTKAAQGDPKALRRLRWIFGLRVITKTNPSAETR